MSKKPKILYLITLSQWGGAQRYVFDLATSVRSDFEVAVAVGAEGSGDLEAKLAKAGVAVIRVKNLIREINLIKDFAAILEIRKILKLEHPDILHINSSKAGILGALAAMRLGIKVVYTVHGWVFLEPLSKWKQTLYLMMERLSCFLRDATILLSEKEKTIAKKNKLNCGIVSVIPHGIDEPLFLERDEARERIAARLQIVPPPGALWIGVVANLYQTKDIPNLMRSISEIEENIFTIVLGNGPERTKLENITAKLNLSSRFALIGEYPNAAELLPALDIFVLPSAKEGLPYALLEAMAAGLPIVVTNVGAMSEVIENNKNGILVPPSDALALRAALKKMILNISARTNLGKSAKEDFGSKYKKDTMLKKTRELYLRVVGSEPKRAVTREA